ncbi:MAG: transglycosylase SLT domain-containing protein [bacterium]
MKKFSKFVFRTIKGIYDILATYLLLFLVPFCAASVVIWLLTGQAATFFEFESRDAMWSLVSGKLGLPDTWIRLAAVLPIHLSIWWLLRRPVALAQPFLEAGFDKVVSAFKWATSRAVWIRTAVEILFSIVVTAVLIPFVIQPTLVPGFGPRSWVERAANFTDGTASAEIADSVVGLYRTWFAEPVVGPAVTRDAVDAVVDAQNNDPIIPPSPNGRDPLMDRWNSYIAPIAAGDLDRFATIKAFMWVESAGRQYAVSNTGCAGLMQFCAGTARNAPFEEIFGTGQVYVCACRDGNCRIPKDVQADLESGDEQALLRHASDFPCRLTDARFDPNKILKAGDRYIDRLSQAFGGNIYLMYIGYNSGPMVAERVWRKLGRNPEATLEQIDAELVEAMRPTYGAGAEARARSLVRTHLPKIKRAKDRYMADGLPTELAAVP